MCVYTIVINSLAIANGSLSASSETGPKLEAHRAESNDAVRGNEPSRRSGERCKLPQCSLGEAPATQNFRSHFVAQTALGELTALPRHPRGLVAPHHRMLFRQAYSVSVWLLSWLYFIHLTAVFVLFLLYAIVCFLFSAYLFITAFCHLYFIQ